MPEASGSESFSRSEELEGVRSGLHEWTSAAARSARNTLSGPKFGILP